MVFLVADLFGAAVGMAGRGVLNPQSAQSTQSALFPENFLCALLHLPHLFLLLSLRLCVLGVAGVHALRAAFHDAFVQCVRGACIRGWQRQYTHPASWDGGLHQPSAGPHRHHHTECAAPSLDSSLDSSSSRGGRGGWGNRTIQSKESHSQLEQRL